MSSSPPRTAVVTGGTAGIGEQVARRLAASGAGVVLVGRDVHRGEAAAEALRAATGNADVAFVSADLSSLTEVRRLADHVLRTRPAIDVLVNNAGAMFAERRLSADGHELSLALNHLGPHLLSELLRPALSASPHGGRIVNVSSSVQRMPFARPDLEDLQLEHRYRGMVAYARAKFANLATGHLVAASVDPNVLTIAFVDPGPTSTALNQGMTRALMPQPMRAAWPLFKLSQRFQNGPEIGAGPVVHAATDPGLRGRTGLFLDRSLKIARPTKATSDAALAQRLLEATRELTGAGAG